MRNIDYGDRDSVGLFQQRPSQGWGTVAQIMDPVYSTNAFYDVLVTVEGWEGQEITDAAQRVQRSAFPNAYAQHEGRGRAFASALSGYSTGALTCHLDPVSDDASAADASSAGGAGAGHAGAGAVPAGAAAPSSTGPIAGATPPARLAVIQQRLDRDFVEIGASVVAPGVLQVDATSLPAGRDPEPERRAWAVAQWAVATASATGARVVGVDGHVWVRDDGDDAAWLPVEGAGLPAGLHDAVAGAAPGDRHHRLTPAPLPAAGAARTSSPLRDAPLRPAPVPGARRPLRPTPARRCGPRRRPASRSPAGTGRPRRRWPSR